MAWLPRKTIVVPYDFSDLSKQAIDTALQIAPEASDVHVVHVLGEIHAADPGVVWHTVDDNTRRDHATESLREPLAEDVYQGVKLHVLFGAPVHRIAEFAQELGADLIVGFTYHIAETEQKAIEQARPYFEENMKMFAPLGFVRGLSDDQIEAIADPKRARSANLPTLEQAIEAGSWLCGPPELIIEKLQDVQDRYPGLEEVNVGSVIGTPQSVILEQLEIFAREVMPAFQSQDRAAAPAD